MKPSEFHPEQFARGHKHHTDLELVGSADGISLPVLLARGARPGKTLVVTAAIHGDEYEGVRTILDVFDALDPRTMAGDFLAVSVSNPPAFWNGTRTSPIDGGNLARLFPGALDAGATSVIAYHIAHAIIARADMLLDLHSAGVQWLMPTMIGYDFHDARSRAAAAAFGASVMWGHPGTAPGRTVTFADDNDIPWLYTEARGAGRIHPDDLRTFVRGVENLLKHLEIIEGEPDQSSVEHHLFGDFDLDTGLQAGQKGFFIPHVGLFDSVKAGQPLGRLCDLHGRTLETYFAPVDGVVAFMRAFPALLGGEPLFLLAQSLGQSQSRQAVKPSADVLRGAHEPEGRS